MKLRFVAEADSKDMLSSCRTWVDGIPVLENGYWEPHILRAFLLKSFIHLQRACNITLPVSIEDGIAKEIKSELEEYKKTEE